MNAPARRPVRAILIGSGLLLVMLACVCGPLQQVQELQATVGAGATAINESAPTFEAMATEAGAVMLTLTATGPDTSGLMGELGITPGSQWASGATASSQYGDVDWSASQATGAPNTTACGDNVTAWASASSSGQDTLMLTYASPVIPTAVVIYHSYNPGSVVKVEIASGDSGALTVYQAQPEPIFECPYQQTIEINAGSVTSPVDTIIISLDQSVIGSWDEIDAVALVSAEQ